jgi:pimeloyl-ACP methyl ester carboxylesterase
MALELGGTARLALRGARGRLWSDLHQPGGSSRTPLLVFFPDSSRPVVDPAALCRTGLTVLVTRPGDPADAVAVVEWAAEHAAELDADPARLLVGGECSGAALAAAVARHARHNGWPPLRLFVPPGTTELKGTTMTRPTTLLAITSAVAAALAVGCATPAADATPEPGRYATVNGLEMYYEVHGPETGRPLVLLHGAFSGIGVDFASLLPELARNRRVIAVEQQAHGHTPDIDRPLRVEHMVDDTVALLDQLGVTQADVLGYSMGSAVALGMGLERPELVHKLVLVSPGYDTNSTHAGLMEGLQDFRPEMLHGTPFHDYYLRAAPRPEDFPVLVEKKKEMDRHYPDHPRSAVQGLAAPVLLVAGDSDIVRNDYLVEFFGLLGGNVIGDMVGLPASQLAILPGTTHLSVVNRPELRTIVPAFLDAPSST